MVTSRTIKLFSHIIMKVFIKCQILSEESILSTYMLTHTHTRTHARTHARTHTHTHTHTHTLTMQSLHNLNLYIICKPFLRSRHNLGCLPSLNNPMHRTIIQDSLRYSTAIMPSSTTQDQISHELSSLHCPFFLLWQQQKHHTDHKSMEEDIIMP